MNVDNQGNAASVAKSDKALVVAAHVCAAGEKPAEGMAQKMITAAGAVRDHLKTSGH